MVYYCYECVSKQHERINLFHIAEKWEVIYNLVPGVIMESQ